MQPVGDARNTMAMFKAWIARSRFILLINPRHRLVARADANVALHQMLLEILHIIRCCRFRRPSQPCRKPLARAQVTCMGCRAEIAGCHIRDHARTKRRHWCRLRNVHGNVLCPSRQNHLDQQHTPNITKRQTNPNSAERQKQAPYREVI